MMQLDAIRKRPRRFEAEGKSIKIPRRRFLGESPEVEKAVKEIVEANITEYFNTEFEIRQK